MELSKIPPVETKMDRRSPDERATQLHGPLLLFARMVWVLLVLATEGLFVASLPAYFGLLQTVCQDGRCAYGQLSAQAAHSLQQFGLSSRAYAIVSLVFVVGLAVFCFICCCIICFRRSNDWMALLVSYIFCVGSTTCVAITVGTSHTTLTNLNQILSVFVFISFYIVFCLFPDGRFVPTWSRWFAIFYSAFIVSGAILSPNPFEMALLPRIGAVLSLFSFFGFLIGFQMYRFRHVSNTVQRQQTKWVLYGFSATVCVIVGGALPVYIWPGSLYSVLFNFAYMCVIILIPLTLAIAILRYQLWDVDVLIKLTLVYSILTALLLLFYVGLIVLLENGWRALFGEGNAITIVASTLIMAALFQPLRLLVQRAIDRRFYRSKYNTRLLLDSFSATMRNELNLEQVSEQLALVVEETMQPTHISLWLRKNR